MDGDLDSEWKLSFCFIFFGWAFFSLFLKLLLFLNAILHGTQFMKDKAGMPWGDGNWNIAARESQVFRTSVFFCEWFSNTGAELVQILGLGLSTCLGTDTRFPSPALRGENRKKTLWVLASRQSQPCALFGLVLWRLSSQWTPVGGGQWPALRQRACLNSWKSLCKFSLLLHLLLT